MNNNSKYKSALLMVFLIWISTLSVLLNAEEMSTLPDKKILIEYQGIKTVGGVYQLREHRKARGISPGWQVRLI